MKHLVSVLIVVASIAVFAEPASLSAKEKDKILFMIFENQNKKTVTKDTPNCKKVTEPNWACANQTGRQFLMNLLRINSAQGFSQSTEISCEAITLDLQKNIEQNQREDYGPLEFRREIKQSLKEQWLCKMSVQQMEPATGTTVVGLSFVMNREKSRIVSRRFAAWTHKN
ncbi:hypothetical protein K2X05_09635 [bacterium]|nr:hypothetical protein [bacterium]